ncbi:hypothetical protein [uncultured Desulfuromusa sp.]|uniref:hypothetical protein n=1 Tax=uncultured Desulfuromusa sp. TaxID=219183 RepID=UPI002AA856A0|nr:hypothetical protein [uncultured Desulfuromusa sp.]
MGRRTPTKNRDRFFLQKRFDKYRRWFADPMTQLLIFQWITKNDDTLPSSIDPDIWNACQEYLLNINVEKLSLPSFLKCCQSRNTLTIPPFLAEYAENKLPSASLPDEVWLRVLTGKNILIRIQPKRPIEQNIGPFEFKYEKQKQLLKELISQLEEAATPLETVDDFLQKHVGDISPILFLLADWAIQLLSPRLYEYEIRNKSGSLAPSSVQNYLRTIGEDLLAEWEDKDITNLEDDKIISIIYATGRRLQGKEENDKDLPDELASEKVYRLRQFYRHIEIFHGAPQIDIIDMLNANGEIISRPNVNLLTFEQYRQVLTNLGWEREKLSRLEKISLFFTIIAFRGGLRSSEIMGLLVGDLQGDRSLEILVRPQHERKLKSPAAKRRIPLHILLSEDELSFILSWLKFRRAEPGVTHKHLLLTEGPLINEQLEVPKQVRVCLKETINDSTFVVHHLRHCYETWLLTRLLLRTDIHLSSVPSFLRSSEFENKNLGDMRDFFRE